MAFRKLWNHPRHEVMPALEPLTTQATEHLRGLQRTADALPERAGREGDQPLPAQGKHDVLAELAVTVPPALAARRAIGIRRYGRPLETWNGRDVHQDLDDELLDALAYARQARLERRDLERDLAAARQANADAEVLLAHARAEIAAARENLELARADLSAEQAATAQMQAELERLRGGPFLVEEKGSME